MTTNATTLAKEKTEMTAPTAQTIIRDGIAFTRFFWRRSEASGKRKGWGKKVTGIDRTGRYGYAIIGEFLRDGSQEFPVGTVFVEMEPMGSVKNPQRYYSVAVVVDIETYAASEPEHQARIRGLGYVWKMINQPAVSPAFLDLVEVLFKKAPASQAAAEAHRTIPIPTPVPVPASDPNPLADFSAEDLIAELEQRGCVHPSWDGEAYQIRVKT